MITDYKKKINYDLKIVVLIPRNLDGNGLIILDLYRKLNVLKTTFLLTEIQIKTKNFINKIKKINPDIKIFTGKYVPQNYSKLRKVCYIQCIGNPHTFSDTLKNLKIKYNRHEKFPDHYDYKESDLQRLKRLAKTKNCELLTTEKDYFRIKKPLRKNINFLKVELLVDKQKQFYKFLNEKL